MLVEIIGTQAIDGESDKVSVFTTGTLEKLPKGFSLSYTETLESGSVKASIIDIDLEKSIVTLTKKSEDGVSLMIQKGVRHNGFLSFPFGEIPLNVVGKDINCSFDIETGGGLYLSYDLELGGLSSSSHTIEINLKPEQKPSN